MSTGKVSYTVRKRYEDKMYKQIAFRVPIDLAKRFREVTHMRGDSQAQILKEAIEEYLQKIEKE